MKKFLCLASLFILLFIRSNAQESTAHSVLTDTVHDCAELQYAVMQLIPLYYQDGIIDTANLLLDFWENHCGTDETIYRTRILWAIDSGTFSDSLINDRTIGFMDTYLWLAHDTTGWSMQDYYYYTPEFELLKWYQSFTDTIAQRALTYEDLSNEERFFADFYLHPSDSLYALLKTSAYQDSKLTKIYTQPVGGVLPAELFNYGLNAGIWKPYDKLGTLGMHPSLGLRIGGSWNRTICNMGFQARLGRSKNDYNAMFEDSLYTTDEFFGLSLGIEAGRKLIDWRRHELDLLGGIDLEMIKVLSFGRDTDTDEDDDTRMISSPGLRVGAEYRYYLKNDQFLGIGSRYHFLNFRNKGGTNLRGNALSITLEYGFGSNAWLHNRNTYLKERLPAGL